MDTDAQLAQYFAGMWPHLDEHARRLAAELTARRHPVSHTKVTQLLREDGYSLQGNRKTEEGGDHPDRDAQFRHINRAVKHALRAVSYTHLRAHETDSY